MNPELEELAVRCARLAEETVKVCSEAGLTCAAAESCTGGLVGHLLTDVAGSSACFLGSAVTYSYEAKTNVLGVSSELLETRGAVNEAVAAQMAAGARAVYGADIAVSITGVAGPGGGSQEKPVGTVFLHVAGPEGRGQGAHRVWDADRAGNKLLSAELALRLVRDRAQGCVPRERAA